MFVWTPCSLQCSFRECIINDSVVVITDQSLLLKQRFLLMLLMISTTETKPRFQTGVWLRLLHLWSWAVIKKLIIFVIIHSKTCWYIFYSELNVVAAGGAQSSQPWLCLTTCFAKNPHYAFNIFGDTLKPGFSQNQNNIFCKRQVSLVRNISFTFLHTLKLVIFVCWQSHCCCLLLWPYDTVVWDVWLLCKLYKQWK